MFRARPKLSVRLKSRPKSKPSADHATRPGKHCPAVGQAKRHATPRTTMPREPGNKPRGRATFRVPRPMHPSEPGRTSHVRPRNHRPNLIRRPSRPTMKHPATTVPTRPRPDCPADRPDRPSERRGRPEAVFEAQSAQFKPKAGADLARLAFQVFLVRYGEGATSLFPYKGDANSPHTTSKHLLSEQEMSSPQAPPPSWDSPPRLSTLKTKKKLLPYLEAADLETSSQAASHQEEPSSHTRRGD
ncbi:unnamed protein product [Microthlaspi erraticum]|uniref:Uncharacterized protein n=1 Tax=Microthlaspi erraticum TaxID=1685480 RepID=A0A6D2I4E4_9BRAS|nr:unnamed protein product [Microthlaspi erraticum]